MKKKILVVIMILLSIFICNLPQKELFAALPQITVQDFEDVNLYKHLQILAGGSLENEVILRRDSFATKKEIDFSAYTTNDILKSYKGLEKFNFNSLETLNLSGNSVGDVSNIFSNMPNLKSLDLSYNNLEQVDLSYLTNLTNLSLAGNYFNDYEDIILYDRENSTDPENPTVKCNVWLNYNELDIETVPEAQNNVYIMGVQGIRDAGLYYESQEITFLPYNTVSHITIYEDNEIITTLPYEENGQTVRSISLSYGKYTIKCTSTNSNDNFILDCDFEVQVPCPVYGFVQNGEAIDQPYKINQALTINFTPIENGSVVFYVNNEKITGNSYTIDKSGTYYIVYYQSVGDNASIAKSFVIECNMDLAMQWVYIIGGIVIFVVAIKLILAYANKPAKGKLETKEKF